MKSNDTVALFEKHKLWIALLGLISAVFVFLSTSYFGAGISPDSVGYISVARNIIASGEIISYDGVPLVIQPPLYPAFLALLGYVFSTDPLLLTHGVNAFIFGLIVYMGGLLFFKHLISFPTLAYLGTFMIMVSSPLLGVSVNALSEPLFALFLLLSFIFAERYLAKKDVLSLILFSSSIALSCLTRYIGVTAILWGALIILFFNHGRPKTKIAHLSLFTIVSALPLGIWLIRNYAISSTFSGYGASSAYTLSQNLSFMFDTLLYWIIPSKIVTHRSIMIFLSVAVVFYVIFSLKDSWPRMKITLRQISPTALFVIVYAVFIVIAATISAYDRIGDRLLSPIYVPLTLLLLVVIQAISEPYRKRFSKSIVNIIMITCVSLWLIYPIRATILRTVDLIRNGQGYRSKKWLDSETIQYLRQHLILESECAVYTNGPDAIYILSDIKTQMSLLKTWYNSPEIANDILSVKGFWPKESNACLIWFDKIDRKYLYTIEELKTVADIDLIFRLEDGAIYSVIRR